jgi:hypothetical protein
MMSPFHSCIIKPTMVIAILRFKLFLFPRTDFKEGVRELCGNVNVWLCTIGYALPSGIVSAWQAVMVSHTVHVHGEEPGNPY